MFIKIDKVYKIHIVVKIHDCKPLYLTMQFVLQITTSGLTAHSDVANLFFTGRDIATTQTGLAGELQSGWISANAILNYSVTEMVAGANIVSDLSRM